MRRPLTWIALAAAVLTVVPAAAELTSSASPANGGLRFEQNLGQTDDQVRFLSRGREHVVFLTSSGISLKLAGPTDSGETGRAVEAVHLRFEGMRCDVGVAGEEPLAGTTNFFVGDDSRRWRRNVPSFARVKYVGAYPGVDVVAYGREGRLEYDLVVGPGADPSGIRLRVDGGSHLAIDTDGNLVAMTALGRRVVQHRPVVYQELGGARTAVSARYSMMDDGLVGFALGPYDPSRAVVIDPVVSWATYLGGRDRDQTNAVALDASGNVYVTGASLSDDFPLENPIQDTQSSYTPHVTKFNPAGSALVYSTFVGGFAHDYGNGIVVDGSGAAYVVGRTFSDNFPTVNAYQASTGGSSDAFAFKLSPEGDELVYSTYLGGDRTEEGRGIAVDSEGRVCITGETESENFPTRSPVQAAHGGGRLDAFVAKLNAAGNGLVYSTYLGGQRDDMGFGLAVSPDGVATAVGETASEDFPTASAYQPELVFGQDAFITRLNAAGAVTYSTYLGGSGHERGLGVDVDSSGRAVVAGRTWSHDFPTENPTQGSLGGNWDAFICRLSSNGQQLQYSSYLGGSGPDEGSAVMLDAAGNMHIAGVADSSDFPLSNPHQGALGGEADAFVATIDGASFDLSYSSYIGGSGDDWGTGIAVDNDGWAHVSGWTESEDFPTLNPFLDTLEGGQDGFVVKVRGSGGAVQGYSYVVGALAHVAGQAGTNWRSNLAVVNAANAQASLTLTYMGGGVTETRTFGLGARGTHEWIDILVSLFGFAQADGVSGSVLITSDQPLRISARTYNAPGTGTYGQYLPALSAGDAITAGQEGIVPMMQRSGSFRTNLGAQNVSETACQVRYVLYDTDGDQVGQPVTRSLSAWQWDQVSDIFGTAGAGDQDLAYATVEVLTPGAEVWFYASLVDNATGDGTTVPVVW